MWNRNLAFVEFPCFVLYLHSHFAFLASGMPEEHAQLDPGLSAGPLWEPKDRASRADMAGQGQFLSSPLVLWDMERGGEEHWCETRCHWGNRRCVTPVTWLAFGLQKQCVLSHVINRIWHLFSYHTKFYQSCSWKCSKVFYNTFLLYFHKPFQSPITLCTLVVCNIFQYWHTIKQYWCGIFSQSL